MASIHFQKNALNNAQYHCRELLEINPVPTSISDEVLESNISKALSLTGHMVKSNYLQLCHRLKKKDTVIVKFKCRKQKGGILINRKNPRNKSDVLTQLKFTGRLFVSESMCHENHQLAYKCIQLKNDGKIHSTWLWNNSVDVKLDEKSQPAKVHHIIDIEKFLGIDFFLII